MLKAKETVALLCEHPHVELEPAGTITISVRDSGPGLSAENLKHLFREGVQFEPNRLQAGGGSGLGLWISKGSNRR